MERSGKKPKLVFLANMIEARDIRAPEFLPKFGKCLPLFFWNVIFFIRALLASKGMGRAFKALPEYNILEKVTGQHLIIEIPAPLMMGWGIKWLQKITIPITRKVIYRAAFYAQDELKATVLGLGSLVKSITEKGRLIKQQGIHIPITHGDAYSVASAFQGVEKMIEEFDIPEKRIGIIGCYGTIGKGLTKLFLSRGYKVIGMGRKKEALDCFKKKCGNEELEVTTDLKYVVNESGVVITTTSATNSLITEAILTKNRRYFIYDVSQPNNLPEKEFTKLINQGYQIIRVDGGFEVGPSQLDLGFWLRLPRRIMYACFVEGVMQALENDNRDHVEEVEFGHILKTMEWAKKWGFSHTPLTCFGEELSKDYVPQRKTSLTLALSRVCAPLT